MLSEELKNLVSQFGTLVLIENNQPKFILLSYDKFKDLVIHKDVDNLANFDKSNSATLSAANNPAQGDEEIVDRLNKEILVLKEQVAEKEKQLITNE